MSVCIQYTRTRSQGVCDTLSLSTAHTYTRRRLVRCVFVKGAFLVAIIRRGLSKIKSGACVYVNGARAQWRNCISHGFQLSLLKRRDFVLHTDNAASGINYGPFNCLNSWPSGAWVPDGRMDGSGADRLFAWRRARAGCIAPSFSQGALLNLAGDCLPVGAQFFRFPAGTGKIFFYLTLYFQFGPRSKRGKSTWALRRARWKTTKNRCGLGRWERRNKNSIPAARSAISHAPWQLHFQFLRNEQINLGPCSTPAQRIDAKLNTDTLVNWLFTESGKVCAQTDADISPPCSHKGRKFLEKYRASVRRKMGFEQERNHKKTLDLFSIPKIVVKLLCHLFTSKVQIMSFGFFIHFYLYFSFDNVNNREFRIYPQDNLILRRWVNW